MVILIAQDADGQVINAEYASGTSGFPDSGRSNIWILTQKIEEQKRRVFLVRGGDIGESLIVRSTNKPSINARMLASSRLCVRITIRF